jgi:hypothetical protein
MLAIAAAVGAMLALAQGAAAAERAKVDVACKETAKKFVFHCMLTLTGRKSHKPLAGAKIRIKADMPAMPMAHNVRPVTAKPGTKPGTYAAMLHVAMYGDWALKMTITGPVRDIVVTKYRFGTTKAGGGMMDHGGKKKMERKHN